ncbi:MAG: PfkB family carbohydrate kinase [Candidatus Omnitrophota bacterium]
MSLVVVGTVALDSIKTPAGAKKNVLGGSAVHFCMSARLFTKVHLVAVVGKDFPQKHFQFLKKRGIDLTSLSRVSGETFRWDGEYKKEDLNAALTHATHLGVLENFIPEISLQQKNIPNVFLANIDPDVQISLLNLMKKPRMVGLDSMNLWIKIKRPSLLRLMKRVDLFVANDGEARMLTGEQNIIKAAKFLRKIGPRWIVIKKGEHGVLFYSDRFSFSFPAFPVEEVVDPTGAGDTFAGGLMGCLSCAKTINRDTFRKAVLYATTAASFNVQGFGPDQTENLTLARMNQRLKKLREFIAP